MCGIWASIGLKATPSVMDIIQHRGPDGSGWINFETQHGPLYIGHRRLAIIDLDKRSDQPLKHHKKNIWVSFNGEIYNFKSLRNILESEGHKFSTLSDTEVILNAYDAWGMDFLNQLNGMFAIVIWDQEQNKLFAIRDRLGIKPLYMSYSPESIAFYSEIKQILSTGFSPVANPQPLADFLVSGLTDHNEFTLFKGVKHVMPGHYIEVSLGLNSILMQQAVRWYQLPCIETMSEINGSTESVTEEYLEILKDSIRLRLQSDAPVGMSLSGGLDSSSLVLLANSLGYNLPTISAGYAGHSIDESKYAKVVSTHVGWNPHLVMPSSKELPDLMPSIIWHQEEPFISTSIFAQWSVFEKAKHLGLKVMVDGQGPDESLAGYSNMNLARLEELFHQKKYGSFAKELFYHLNNKSRRSAGLRSTLAHVVRRSSLNPHSYENPTWLLANQKWGLDLCPSAIPSADSLGSLCKSMVFSQGLRSLLRYQDRSSMAHSIEAREPFLDYRLIELCIKLGSHHKIQNGQGKVLLRNAVKHIMPTSIMNRRDKIGFETPEKSWFQNELKDFFYGEVSATLKKYNYIFDELFLTQKLLSFQNNNGAYDPLFWRIITLGYWARTFKVEM